MMEPTKEILQLCWSISTYVSLVLFFVSLKWRRMAHMICYLETCMMVIEMAIPLKHVLEMPIFYRLILGFVL